MKPNCDQLVALYENDDRPVILINSMGTVIGKNKVARRLPGLLKRLKLDDYIEADSLSDYRLVLKGKLPACIVRINMPDGYWSAAISADFQPGCRVCIVQLLSLQPWLPVKDRRAIEDAGLAVLSCMTTALSAADAIAFRLPQEDASQAVLQTLRSNLIRVKRMNLTMDAYHMALRGGHKTPNPEIADMYQLTKETTNVLAADTGVTLVLTDRGEAAEQYYTKLYAEEFQSCLLYFLSELVQNTVDPVVAELKTDAQCISVSFSYTAEADSIQKRTLLPHSYSSLVGNLVRVYLKLNGWILKRISGNETEPAHLTLSVPRSACPPSLLSAAFAGRETESQMRCDILQEEINLLLPQTEQKQ